VIISEKFLWEYPFQAKVQRQLYPIWYLTLLTIPIPYHIFSCGSPLKGITSNNRSRDGLYGGISRISRRIRIHTGIWNGFGLWIRAQARIVWLKNEKDKNLVTLSLWNNQIQKTTSNLLRQPGQWPQRALFRFLASGPSWTPPLNWKTQSEL
jgi:hypothetical protein